MTVRETLKKAAAELAAAGIENADFEAACLYEKHFGVNRSVLLSVYGEEFSGEDGAFFADVAKRAAGEPLQYLLGEWEFMGFPFAVGPGVLIPRPETEILTETALKFLRGRKSPCLLDLCFGSGCIGISCALFLKNCRVTGVELSGDAIRWAEKNAAAHQLGDRVGILRGDILRGPDSRFPDNEFDIIVCNPPYIPSGDITGLDIDVRGFEPHAALDGGEDGLKFYRAFSKWTAVLKHGGKAMFEVGLGQAGSVAEILRGAGLRDIFIINDYAGIERVVGGTKV